MLAGEAVDVFGEGVEALLFGKAVIVVAAGLVVAVFNALQNACDADLNEFVEVGRGDGEELDAFEEWVGFVLRFFEHATIEEEPGFVTIEEEVARRGVRYWFQSGLFCLGCHRCYVLRASTVSWMRKYDVTFCVACLQLRATSN